MGCGCDMSKDNLEKRIKEGVIISDSFPLSDMFVGRLIGKGNYFNIYETEVREDKKDRIILDYVIKIPKEDPLLSSHLEALLQNEKRKYTKIFNTFKSCYPAPNLGDSAKVRLNGKEYNALLLEKIKGKKLSEFVKEYINKKEFLPMEIIIKTAEAMLLLLKKLHFVNEVYGDSFIPNIIIEQEGDLYYNVRIVDLGGVKPRIIQHSSSSDIEHQWNELDDLQAFADALYYAATLTKPGKKNKSASSINKEVPIGLSDLIDNIWEGKIEDLKEVESVIKGCKTGHYKDKSTKKDNVKDNLLLNQVLGISKEELTDEGIMNRDMFNYILITFIVNKEDEDNISAPHIKTFIKFMRLIGMVYNYEPDEDRKRALRCILKASFGLSFSEESQLRDWFLNYLTERYKGFRVSNKHDKELNGIFGSNEKFRFICIPHKTIRDLGNIIKDYFNGEKPLYDWIQNATNNLRSNLILNIRAEDLARRILNIKNHTEIKPYTEPSRIIKDYINLINSIIEYYIFRVKNYKYEPIIGLVDWKGTPFRRYYKFELYFTGEDDCEKQIDFYWNLLISSPFKSKKEHDECLKYFSNYRFYSEIKIALERKYEITVNIFQDKPKEIIRLINDTMIQSLRRFIIPHHQQ